VFLGKLKSIVQLFLKMMDATLLTADASIQQETMDVPLRPSVPEWMTHMQLVL
jgi:hypothetical protein